MSAIPGVARAVTPSDTTDLIDVSQLYIGVTGDVKVMLEQGGEAVVLKAHPVGYCPLRVKRVYATGTTATNIIALSA